MGNLFDSGGGGILNSIIPRQSNLKLSHINTLIREYRKLELDTISPDNLGLNKTNDWLKHWESYPFGEPITAFGCWHDQGINNNMDDRWFIAQLTSGQLFGIFDAHSGNQVTTQMETEFAYEFDRILEEENKGEFNKEVIAKVFLKTVISIDNKLLQT